MDNIEIINSHFCILVVDDCEAWRRKIRLMLQQQMELEVVGEASDGLEAVQKARELHPNLILLDIGLPNLNGLDAARLIRTQSPESKILFLSQESETDILQEGFAIGARGYVVKMDVVTELLFAVACVLRGDVFVGTRFAGVHFEQHV